MASTDADLSSFRDRLTSDALTPSQRRVAQIVLATPERIALSTLGELADALGVNQSTIARFCAAVGLPGYSELRGICKRLSASRETMLSRFLANAQPASNQTARRAEVAADDRTSIAATFAAIDDAEWSAITRLLSEASAVGVVGVRQSHAPAMLLGYLLGLVRGGVSTLSGREAVDVDRLRPLTGKDVIVAISTHPCSTATVEVVRWALDRGIPVVAITDPQASELAAAADHALLAETTGPSVLSSMTAIVAVVQALVDAVSRVDPARTERNLREESELLARFHVHSAPSSSEAE